MLIYAVAITNSLTEQLAKHMVIDLRIRMLVSLGVVLILNLIFLMGRHATIRVMGFLVFPLIAYFLFLSIYLVGSWQPDLLTTRRVQSEYPSPDMDIDSRDGFRL